MRALTTRTIHGAFEMQVPRTPRRAAVSYAGTTLTYRELNVRANRLAHALQRRGIAREDRIGLLLPRGVDAFVALLGILKSGGAYLPLDPTWPTARLDAICRQAAVDVIVTARHVTQQVVTPVRHTLYVDTGEDDAPIAGGGSCDDNPGLAIDGSHLAYVIYTSGSTGVPKGVMVEHRSVLNLHRGLRAAIYRDLPGRGLRIGVNGPLTFDTSVKQIVQLCDGHSLVVLPDEARLDTRALAALLERTPLDVLDCTPTQLAAWLAAGLFDGRARMPATILVGGEAIPPALWSQLLALRATRFFNLYGPTECTVDAITCRIAKAHPTPRLGRALPRVSLYVLDEAMRPVASGAAGELYIGGVSVARGYVHAPALTADRFVPCPFPTVAEKRTGARLYRTGDRVRCLPDGEIEFVDRLDRQIKLNGHRIELGEIEAVLARHPSVRTAVVVARETGQGTLRRLAAYLVPSDEPRANRDGEPRDVRQHLREQLPAYMQPATVTWLEALPMTTNGKVDRAALPEPSDEPETAFVAPRTATERALAGIWSEVLGRARIGVHDRFLDLGGHSLLVGQVAARVRDAFDREIALDRFFACDSIAQLASLIDNDDGARTSSAPGTSSASGTCSAADRWAFPPIPRVAREPRLPVSTAQERIWFLQRLAPDNVAYLFRTIIRFHGRLDVAALERALTEVVRRHEIFRTTFPEERGRPRQEVHAAWAVSLPIADLEAAGDRREACLREICDRAFRAPFDVASLPLARWTLVRLDAEHFALVHVEHHLIHDGWSFNVFLSELGTLYAAFVRGEPSPLPELPVQFADFCAWQRAWMTTGDARRQVAYWRDRLADAPPALDLPFDRPRAAWQTFGGATERLEVPSALANALRATSRREQVTLFMTMLAAFYVLLERYTGQDDLSVGTGMANRRRREAECLIGMIINTVVLRTRLDGDPTLRDLLQRVRATALEAYAHQDVSFDAVVDAVQPRRDPSHNPLFQVAFSFHDAPLPSLDLPGVRLTLEDLLDNGSAKFDLNLIVIPRAEQETWRGDARGARVDGGDGGGITMIWEYNTDLFDPGTIRRLTTHYTRLLEALAESCDARVSELPAALQIDEARVAAWNATAAPVPEACVHALFRRCAAARPDAIAVLDRHGSLTYRELDRRARVLARRLRARGARRGAIVGVCVDRGTALATALLAILETGAAYLPLDYQYPPNRVRFVLKDAGVSLLVSDEVTRARVPVDGLAVVDVHDVNDVNDVNDVATGDSAAAGANGRHSVRDGAVSEGTGADLAIVEDDESWPDVHLDDLAYVIYTSGSTGTPKGVAVSHRALTGILAAVGRELKLSAADRVCAVSSIAFDIATLELLLPLSIGASCWIAGAQSAERGELSGELAASRATVVQMTPSAWRLLLDHGWRPDSPVTMMAGGEPLSRALADALLRRGRVWNGYGPTEATIYATGHHVTSREGVVPIGRPLANTQAYVLNQRLQQVPIGVFGDLFLGGVGLAAGYLDRPALTAAAFVPNPFSSEIGSRMYRTGDRARYRADGTLEFGGRRDGQVKLRGFRIELGEIESVLARHPAVRDVAVAARPDARGEPRLIAYLVARGPSDAATRSRLANELREQLKAHLPAYMVPATMVWLAALPRTANGKLDRAALPEPPSVEPSVAPVEPQTARERALAAIWSEVLGRTAVGVQDNFFDLGGHSLSALQLASLVRHTFAIDLPIRTVFEQPVLADMARVIDERSAP